MSWPRILVLTLVGCSFSGSLWAQDFREGYVITNTNDSINGFISYKAGKKNLEQCAFKATRKSEIVYYTASQLQSYGFYGDKRYISFSIPDEAIVKGNVFVRVLAEGPISLYRYGKMYLIKKDVVTILPVPKKERIETEKGTRVKADKRYVGLLNMEMADCNLDANRALYSESDLTKVINAYNKCKGQVVTTKNLKPIVKFDYQAFAGYVRSDFNVSAFKPTTFNPSYTIIGGLGVDVSSPRIFDRLFFSMQGWYVNSTYQSYVEKKQTGDLRQDVIMELAYIKIPIGIRYNLLKHNTPYIKGGLSTTYLLDESTMTLTEREGFNGVVFTEESSGGYDMKSRTRGLWISIGYDYTIHKNLRLFAEFQYEGTDGFVGTAIQDYSNTKNFNFLMGIRF